MSSTLTRYLHEEIQEWYRVAYGDIKSHKTMIDYYSFGTSEKVNYLLSGFENHFEIEHPKNILDVGCGYGSVAAYLAKKFEKADVLATDVSSNYYRCGEQAAKRSKISNIKFRDGRAEELDDENQYDLIICCNMLNFLNSSYLLNQTLSKLCGALKPGGKLVIHTPHFWSLREPFTRIPLLHFFPTSFQSYVANKLGGRNTLSDVRNPSEGEIVRTVRKFHVELKRKQPLRRIARLRNTHITLWFEKHDKVF